MLTCPFCESTTKDGEITKLGLPNQICPSCGAESKGQCDDCLAEVFNKGNEWKCWKCKREGKPGEFNLWENM